MRTRSAFRADHAQFLDAVSVGALFAPLARARLGEGVAQARLVTVAVLLALEGKGGEVCVWVEC